MDSTTSSTSTRSFAAPVVALLGLALGGACGGARGDAAGTDSSSSGEPASSDDAAASDSYASSGEGDASSGGPILPCTDCDGPPTVLWQHAEGGPYWESAFAAGVSSDGRVAAAGPVDWPFTSGFLSIYEADGTVVTTLATPDNAYGLVWDSETSFVVAAQMPGGTGVSNLRRYDRDGNELWSRTEADTSIGALTRTTGGTLITGGGTSTSGLIARYDASGAPLATISTPIDLYISDLAVGHDGLLAVGTDVDDNPWIGKYDGHDELLWSHAEVGSDTKAVAVAEDGTVFAAIQTVADTPRLLSFAPDGTPLPDVALPWTYGLITDLRALADGDVLVVTSVTEASVHCSLTRVTSAGQMTWGVAFADFAEFGDNECTEVHVAPDGTLVAVGVRRDLTGDGDPWVVAVQP